MHMKFVANVPKRRGGFGRSRGGSGRVRGGNGRS